MSATSKYNYMAQDEVEQIFKQMKDEFEMRIPT